MEKLPFLVFKERSSLDFGLLIAEKGSYNAAERDVTYTSVPGRSGDLITDNGRYKNIDIPYKMTLLNNTALEFAEIAHQIKGWLLSETGYFKLWDSYDDKYFRLASYKGGVNIEQELKALGSLSLTFNCKPYKYSIEGQKPIVLTAAGSLFNAEYFHSTPYVKVVGSGTVTLNINAHSFLLKNIDEYIELEFEMPNAYKGIESKNACVSGGDMSTLTLAPGYNSISWTGAVERVEIIPRWCCL